MGKVLLIEILKNKITGFFQKNISLSATSFGSEISSKARIRQKVRFYDSSISEYSYIGRNSLVQNTKIGKFCSISEFCNIGLPSHPTEMISTSPVFLEGKNCLGKNFAHFHHMDCPETVIGNDVWIGSNTLIKSGLKIGDGAVIGAGSVVTHDVEPYAIVAGTPAKLLRYRFSHDDIEMLLKTCWWDWDEDEIVEKQELFYSIEKFKDLEKR